MRVFHPSIINLLKQEIWWETSYPTNLNTIKFSLKHFSFLSSFFFKTFMFLSLMSSIFLFLYPSLSLFSLPIITHNLPTAQKYIRLTMDLGIKMRRTCVLLWPMSTSYRGRHDFSLFIVLPLLIVHSLFLIFYSAIDSFAYCFINLNHQDLQTNSSRTFILIHNKIFFRFPPFLVKNYVIVCRAYTDGQCNLCVKSYTSLFTIHKKIILPNWKVYTIYRWTDISYTNLLLYFIQNLY